MTDHELLRLIVEKDATAFREWYDRHAPSLYAYLCRLLGDQMASEDVLSETMFTVWKDAPRFRGDSKPRTWLYRIARNKAIDLIRKRPAAPLSLVGDSNATARADDVDLRLSLEQALAALSPDHREVVELTFFHGLSYDEIARVVGCPVNTVKTRMFWAKRKLRALLNPPEAGAEEVTG